MYAGLTTTGYPILFANSNPLSKSVTISLTTTGWFICLITSLNVSLSSPFLIDSTDVPIISTLYFSSIPASCNSTAKLRAV